MTQASTRLRYFVTVSPGLESLLHSELQELGIAGHPAKGGVECSGSFENIWSIHHFSRVAESVRVRLRPFEAHGFAELEQNLRRIPWHAYVRKDDAFTLSVTCQGSRLYHTEAISERVARIIRACVGCSRARVEAPDGAVALSLPPQKFHVRVHRNLVQVSVDASGERLHRRGYRTHVGNAPLRETLAAAMVRLLRQRVAVPTTRLWDPCCGSGTLLAEWLISERGWVATSPRSYAFERWPIHADTAYRAWLATCQPSQPVTDQLRAYGSDIDPRSIEAARHNLGQAQLLSNCELFAQDFRAVSSTIPAHTALISNLPYGVRLIDSHSAARLFLQLDDVLWKRDDLRPVVLLMALPRLPPTRCQWASIATFANGGLRVTAWSIR